MCVFMLLGTSRASAGNDTPYKSLRLYHVVYSNSPLCDPLAKLYNRLSKRAYGLSGTGDKDLTYSNFEITSPNEFASIGLVLQLGNEHPLGDDSFTYHYRLGDGSIRLNLALRNDGPSTVITDSMGNPFGYSVWRTGAIGYILQQWPGYKIASAAIKDQKKEYTKMSNHLSSSSIRPPAISGDVQQQIFQNRKNESYLIIHDLFSVPAGKAGGSRLALIRITPLDHTDICYISLDDTADDKIFANNVQHDFNPPK